MVTEYHLELYLKTLAVAKGQDRVSSLDIVEPSLEKQDEDGSR